MRYLLGLDIGTSGTKTALFDEFGNTIKTKTYEYKLYQPKSGWAEQDPKDWWEACVKGIKGVIEDSKVNASDIKGIGLSGQMHGLVLLDKDNKVIRKSIIWCDQRTEKECEYITETIGKEKLIKITGNPALTGFTLSKLLWVRNNEKDNYKKIKKVLLPKDYIRFKLTGVFASTDSPKFDKYGRVHTLCHAVPNKWHVMGVTQGAGLSLNWFKRTFCEKQMEQSEATGRNVYDILTEKASKSKPGANGVVYLPYLMGERTPHLDPNVKGAFLGVSLINNHDDFVRAILEGVSFSLKNCLDIIEDMNIKIKDIRISGGGAESEIWSQILADIFNYELTTIKASERPALGVAILAAVGAGIYESVEEACEKIIKGGRNVQPNEELKEIYKQVYKIYNTSYRRIEDFGI